MILKDDILNGLTDIVNMTLDKCHFEIHNIYNLIVSPFWQIPNRTIQDWMLVYIREGNGYYKIEEKKYNIKAGNIYFISNAVYHSAKYEKDTLPNVIAIRFGLYDNKTSLMTNKVKPFSFCINTARKGIFQQAFQDVYLYNLKYPQNISISLCHIALSRIFQMIYMDMMDLNNNKIIDDRMENVKLYINENMTNNLNIKEISDYVKLSPKYLSKLFKNTYGITIKSYIFKTKIYYANFLLEESDLTIKEIALMLGYSDQYIFSNQFKSVIGKSPSKIRNKNK